MGWIRDRRDRTMPSRSLTIKIPVIVILTMLLTSVATGFYTYNHEQSIKKREMQKEARNILERLAYSLRSPIWVSDENQIKDIVNLEILNHNISSIIVTTQDGNLLYGLYKDPRQHIQNIKQDDLLLQKVGIEGEVFFTIEIKIQNEVIGSIKVSTSNKNLDYEMLKTVKKSLIDTTLMIIPVLIVLLLIINYFIIRPIRIMKDESELIAKNSNRISFSLQSKDEFETLSNYLNRMVYSLKKKQKKTDDSENT